MVTVMNTNGRLRLSLSACGLALLIGCATTTPNQRKEAPENAEPVAGGGPVGEAPTDVFKPAAKPPAEARVSEEQQADFEKAVGVYQKLRKDGSLKGPDCEQAAAAFRSLADRYPTMLIARHNEASVYMECGNKQQATRLEEELARKNYAPALSNLGYAAMISGDSAQAESYFNRAIDADKQAGSIAARINLAQILRDKARRASAADREKYIKDALVHLRTVLAVDGNSLQAYATMCFIYFDLNLPDAAVLIGTQAIKRAEEIATGKFEDETVAETVNRDRAAKGKKGKKEDKGESSPGPKSTKEVNAQGTGWTPEMKKYIAVVHNTLGLVALKKKSYKDAIPSFKRAVDLDPELYEARMNLAAVSLRFRDYNTAEDQFRAVAAAQPRNYEAAIGLGVAQRGNKKYVESEQQYLAAQKIDPGRADSYFNLGLLYQEYKGSERPTLEKAQQFYRDYLSRAGSSNATQMRRDAEKRIKDIDELFVALAEAKKMQEEADRIQREAEVQQKKMQEEMRRQEEAEKQKGATPSPEKPAPGAPVAPPAAGAAASGTSVGATTQPAASAPPSTSPPPAATPPPASNSSVAPAAPVEAKPSEPKAPTLK